MALRHLIMPSDRFYKRRKLWDWDEAAWRFRLFIFNLHNSSSRDINKKLYINASRNQLCIWRSTWYTNSSELSWVVTLKILLCPITAHSPTNLYIKFHQSLKFFCKGEVFKGNLHTKASQYQVLQFIKTWTALYCYEFYPLNSST